MEEHKQKLDKEYENILTQFSKELEKLQMKHQQELERKVNIQTQIFSFNFFKCEELLDMYQDGDSALERDENSYFLDKLNTDFIC